MKLSTQEKRQVFNKLVTDISLTLQQKGKSRQQTEDFWTMDYNTYYET